MKRLNKLFGRKQGPKHEHLPPEFRPIVAKLPQLPTKQQQLMESIIAQAVDAGVYSLDDMLAFLETQPTHLILFWSHTLVELLGSDMGERGRSSSGRKRKAEGDILDGFPSAEEMGRLTSEQRGILSERIGVLLSDESLRLTEREKRGLAQRWRAILEAEFASMTPEERRFMMKVYESLEE
jgi:hypothetical protein